MKNLLILLTILFASVVSFSQETGGADQILKDLFGKDKTEKEKKDAEVNPEKDEKPSVESEDDVEVYKEYFLSSIGSRLFIGYQAEEKLSRRSMEEATLLPAIHINKSLVTLESLTEDMNVKKKKNKIKGKFIFENYVTEKQTKVSSFKVIKSVIFKSYGKKSDITLEGYNESMSALILYLENNEFTSISVSKGGLTEAVARLPVGVSGFIIQKSIGNEDALYALTGVYDGVGKRSSLFKASQLEDFKKI